VARTLNERQRRWLNALLILTTITVALVLVSLVANILVFLSDILLIFFLAWLLAFVLSPVVTFLDRGIPMLPRQIAVVVTYGLMLVALSVLILVVAQSLFTSISSFVASVPSLQERLPEVLAPWQNRLRELGLAVDLVAGARSFLSGLGTVGGDVLAPLSGLALASLGVFGSVLLILFLSLYMLMDRDRILAFLVRLVPARYTEEARLFQTSVSSSFGGFLRGQAIMGVIYGLLAAVVHLALGLPYGPASAATAGMLQAIPFFGPFLSWAPPVAVAILTKPEAALPALLVMAIGWFVVMNVIQPRLMASAVGIHPVVVFGSVMLGLKMAGIVGAIFGIPIAAVISSFFFYYLNRSATLSRDATSRAARHIEEDERRRRRAGGATLPAAEAAADPFSQAEAGDMSTRDTVPGDAGSRERSGAEPKPQHL
jgi:predicted PurR-regulated permease PerM